MNKTRTLIICFAILLTGGLFAFFIFLSEPTAARTGATKETAMLVEVRSVEKGTYRPIVRATGTVMPSKEIILSPRVEGQILKVSPAFVPGGTVREGQILMNIDPSDYANALALRKSELSQAEADLHIEQGRQIIAQKDYELVGQTLPEENKELVLRKPQLNAIEARIRAAEASVDLATLNLQRTTIRAPFDAQIIERNVNTGSQVSTTTNLARLVGTDVYWVQVTLPVSKLQWIEFPGTDRVEGSEATLHAQGAWKDEYQRKGYVYKVIGALDQQTRMARILIAVPDPLARTQSNTGLPQLMINSFMETQINGTEIQEVVKLNRDYLRQNETVWIMDKGELRIREVDIVFNDATHSYIREGLEEGDQVVITNLSTVTEGAPLRMRKSDTTQPSNPVSDTGTTRN